MNSCKIGFPDGPPLIAQSKICVLQAQQMRTDVPNKTSSCWWKQPGTRTGSTLQMIRWSFHQNVKLGQLKYLLVWPSCWCWSDLDQSALEQKRLWTSHEQQVCCLQSQFPTYGCIPQRLLSIAISSTDIPTSSEVTLYIIVVLFGRLHFLSCSLFFFFYIWTIFCPSDCVVWWFSGFVLTDTRVRALEQGFKGIVRPKTSCSFRQKITPFRFAFGQKENI